jgi:hypothetical protein
MDDMQPDDLDWDDSDAIFEEGEKVYSLYWDSGAPGAGAGYESVYKWNGQYYLLLSDGDDENEPFDTLREAIDAGELTYVNSAMQEITSTELSAIDIVAMLNNDKSEPAERLTINGELWQRDARGSWLPVLR